jgi:hypothetical protein
MHRAYSSITRIIPAPPKKTGLARRKKLEGLRRSHSEKKVQIIKMKKILFKTCVKFLFLIKRRKQENA